MADKKAATLWRVNLISFGLFCVLALTGLTNWLVLPRGYAAGGADLWVSLRHFLRFVHEWTAGLFILAVLVHLALHGGYIRSRLKKGPGSAG